VGAAMLRGVGGDWVGWGGGGGGGGFLRFVVNSDTFSG